MYTQAIPLLEPRLGMRAIGSLKPILSMRAIHMYVGDMKK